MGGLVNSIGMVVGENAVEGVNEMDGPADGEKVSPLMNADGAAEGVDCTDGEAEVTSRTCVGPVDGANELVGALVGESVEDAAARSILTGKHIPFPEHSAKQPSPRLHFPKSSLCSGTDEWGRVRRVE